MVKPNLKFDLKGLNIEEILNRDISVFGNGSHVILPQKHKNKKVVMIVLK